jgi:hypothetical protein
LYFYLGYYFTLSLLLSLPSFSFFSENGGVHKNKTAGGEKSKGKQIIIPCSLVPNGNILKDAHACFSIVLLGSTPPSRQLA